MTLSNTSIGIQTLDNSWNPEFAPVHASHAVDIVDLVDLSVEAGATVVRIPVDLSTVTADGFPQWQIHQFREILEVASANSIEVIFQPGQTPVDLSSDGTVHGVPATSEAIAELAQRFATGVDQVYEAMPELANLIQGWEIGNEPNLSYNYTGSSEDTFNQTDARFFSVNTDNAEKYAEYLAATSAAIKSVNSEVDVYAAGVAHNDATYLEVMFATLQSLNADIDGFAIHPYTTYAIDDHGNIEGAQSGRATDWVGNADDMSAAWDQYYSFQGALKTAQELMNKYGYGAAELWVTEFGVPSYLGNRSAGEDGVLDQARWYAEAFGVIDSLELASLTGVIAHHALDNKSYEQNLAYNAHDADGSNDGTWFEAEASFGLFHEVDGTIEAKAAAGVVRAVSEGVDFHLENIHSTHTAGNHDFSGAEQSTGIVDGVIALVHDGDDTVTGSRFSDSLFGGEGNDTLYGGEGDDRIYGGNGNDVISGGEGADDLYGNAGDDVFHANGDDRIDGGSGHDRIVLKGLETDYAREGNDELVISGNGETITARQIEEIEFADGSVLDLATGEISAPSSQFETEAQDVQAVSDIAHTTQYLNGIGENDTFIINGDSSDYGWGPTQDGLGIVVWGPTGHDLLYDFEEIRFLDQSVRLVEDNDTVAVDGVHDIAGSTQYLYATTENDKFIIDGHSSDFGWDLTQDGLGVVVWNNQTKSHDLLYDFDEIVFNDKTVSLADHFGQQAREIIYANTDNEAGTQYLFGSDEAESFTISGNSSDYGWDKTQDGTGVVVWSNETGEHDILWDYDQLQFNDTAVDLSLI